MRKLILVGGACLAVGLLLGVLLGRFLLEREWSQPNVLQRVSAADAQRSTGKDADPSPKQGSLLLGPAPVARARLVLAEVTRPIRWCSRSAMWATATKATSCISI